MSDIDFQNGFLCGMATKGMLRTGQQYEPKIWNDEGVYTYFYIDFKQGVQDFSIGMVSLSIVVHDSLEIVVTDVKRISPSVYKLYCNLLNRPLGVTVTNKKDSDLVFVSGRRVPAFSTRFFVAGYDRSLRAPWAFNEVLLHELSAYPIAAQCALQTYEELIGNFPTEPTNLAQTHTCATAETVGLVLF